MNAKDIAYGYAIGYNDGIQNGGSGGGDTDTDPDYALWQALPEPESNQVIFVLHVLNTAVLANQYDCMWVDDSDHPDGNWDTPLWTIDWGDGATDTVTNTMTIYHRYTTAGRYIVTCTALADICRKIVYNNRVVKNYNNNTVLMVKYGADIGCVVRDYYYRFNLCLKYFKHKGNPTLRECYFSGCYALKTVDIATPMSIVYEEMFYKCTSLKNVNLSAVTSIQSNGFRYCGLKKINIPLCTNIGDSAFLLNGEGRGIISINAPICTSVGDNAFLRCYSLTNTVFADGCTFGNNAFLNCHSLYPHPDGSTD